MKNYCKEESLEERNRVRELNRLCRKQLGRKRESLGS